MPVAEIETRVSSAEFAEWLAVWKFEHEQAEKERRKSQPKPGRGSRR